jgi:hypothetical protein
MQEEPNLFFGLEKILVLFFIKMNYPDEIGARPRFAFFKIIAVVWGE